MVAPHRHHHFTYPWECRPSSLQLVYAGHASVYPEKVGVPWHGHKRLPAAHAHPLDTLARAVALTCPCPPGSGLGEASSVPWTCPAPQWIHCIVLHLQYLWSLRLKLASFWGGRMGPLGKGHRLCLSIQLQLFTLLSPHIMCPKHKPLSMSARLRCGRTLLGLIHRNHVGNSFLP